MEYKFCAVILSTFPIITAFCSKQQSHTNFHLHSNNKLASLPLFIHMSLDNLILELLRQRHKLGRESCDTDNQVLETFRRYTGKSIHNYLTQRRLEHARRLLQNGVSVTEACYQSGFSDCSGFITLFKKHFGITPGKYQ